MLNTMNNLMSLAGNKTIEIRFDPFHDSKGFDTDEVLNVANEVLGLESIKSANIVANYDEEPLMQACDLLVFYHRRGIDPATAGDPFFEELAPYNLHDFIPPKRRRRNRAIDNMIHGYAPNSGSTLHYAIVYNEVYQINPQFAQEYLADPNEMNRRFHSLSGQGAPQGTYVSLLKDPSAAREYL